MDCRRVSSVSAQPADSEDDIVTPVEVLANNVLDKAPTRCPPESTNAGEATVAGKSKDYIKKPTNWIVKPPSGGFYLDQTLPPCANVREAFEDMAKKALNLGMDKILRALDGKPLKIATMCSGTEMPIVALDLLRDALNDMGIPFNFEHVFSAEIVPWKQEWILRNFEPNLLFRDITEMHEGESLTVFGEHAKIPPPGSVQILVAGFACVDFSQLNNKKKNLGIKDKDLAPDEKLSSVLGESALTLVAILRYARQYRPPILLLENISGADWSMIMDLLNQIGYSAGVAKVDTKFFYLPHTRQRGYLVAFNNRKGEIIGGLSKELADRAVLDWAEMLKKFFRHASSPVDDFLMPDDHPDLQRALRYSALESGTQWETDTARDWSVCAARYFRYRESRYLGNRTPYTHWPSGRVRPPEHVHAVWLQKQPNRVKDTFDIIVLARALNYDASYKSRFPDASQNVDRSVDMAKPGIIGCITPSNVAFHMGKGRPPVGLEQLALQGINVRKLLVGREPQKHMRDLAGNGMSTTVVGACMISALLVGLRAIDSRSWGDRPSKREIPWIGDRFLFDYRSELISIIALDVGPAEVNLSKKHFCELAVSTARKCGCEGQWNQTTAPLGQCVECGHTACVNCGGNPVHEYDMIELKIRHDPKIFVKTASQYLPTRLRLTNFDNIHFDIFATLNSLIIKEKLAVLMKPFQEEQAKISKHRSKKLAKGQLPVEIQVPEGDIAELMLDFVIEDEELVMVSTHRQHYWTIHYESENLKLLLTINEVQAEWELYVKPLGGVAAGSVVRQILQQPVATMSSNMQDESISLLQGSWTTHAYDPQKYKARIQATGKRLPSWQAELGLKALKPSEMFVNGEIHVSFPGSVARPGSTEVLKRLTGIYRLLPNCGAAMRSLHRKTSDDAAGIAPVFLFLESGANRDGDLDEFVFAEDFERLPQDYSRRIIARLTTPWTCEIDVDATETSPPEVTYKLSPVDRDAITRYWRPNDPVTEDFDLYDLLNLNKSGRVRRTNWRPSDKFHELATIIIDFRLVPCPGRIEAFQQADDLCIISDAPELVTEPLMFLNPLVEAELGNVSSKDCRISEGLLLLTTIPSFGRNPDGRQGNEPCMITDFNQRHMSINLHWLISRLVISGELRLWNQVEVSPADYHCTTCSPAAPNYVPRQMPSGGLLPMEDPEAIARYLLLWKSKPSPLTLHVKRSRDKVNAQDLCVTVNLRCLIHRLLGGLPHPTHRHLESRQVSWRVCTDVNLDRGIGRIGQLKVHDCTRESPLMFNFGTSDLALRTDQARVFRWMKSRDTSNAEPFREIVVEEAVSTHLRWSIEAQSARTTVIRGGLCADHVGFGKTIVVLATIRAHMHQARAEARSAIEKGIKSHIPVRATLVLVPGALTYQWAEEVAKFWPDCAFIMINSMEDLYKHSVRDFQSADIIIASVGLLSQSINTEYTNRMAEIAGMANPATFTMPRQRIEWAKSVDVYVSEFVADIQNGELSQADIEKNLARRAWARQLNTAQHLEPSKRRKGRQLAAYQRAQLRGRRQRQFRRGEEIVDDRRTGNITGFVSESENEFDEGTDNDPRDVGDAQLSRNMTLRAENTVLSLPRSIVPSKRSFAEFAGKVERATQAKSTTRKEFYGPIFSMFHFHRKIIDEISYLNQYQEIAIKSIPSNITWLLSGTARLRDVMDVKKLAAMIGVYIGPDDDSEGHITEGNRRVVEETQTKAEEIDASRVVHTEKWHKTRLIAAQAFLDRFARTNQVELPPSTRVRIKEVVWIQYLPAVHAVLYHELLAMLRSEDFKDDSMFSGVAKHDRSLRLKFGLNRTSTIEEAAIKGVFFIPRSDGWSMMQHSCHEQPDVQFTDIIAARYADVQRIARGVVRRVDEYIDWLENKTEDLDVGSKRDANYILDVFKRVISLISTKLMNGLEDPDATEQLKRIYTYSKIPVTEYPGIPAVELRKRLDRLERHVVAMVSAVQSLRYIENAERMQRLAWQEQPVYITDDLGHVVTLSNTRINAVCGHVTCLTCARETNERICPLKNCGAGAGSEMFVKATDLGESDPNTTYSSLRIQTVLNIVLATKADSQVLVFCQWHDLNEVLLHHLDKAGISAKYIRDGENSTAQKVASFKNLRYGHPNWIKLMILNPLSATAAGHNLQNVNAIVFLTPLSGTSIDDYTAAYTQSIGRAARFGQKETVRVYHLLAARTIEVNIHESRRNKKLYVKDDEVIECLAEQAPIGAVDMAVEGYVPAVPE